MSARKLRCEHGDRAGLSIVPVVQWEGAPAQSRWKDPRTPGRGGGLTYAQGPHVTNGKDFLGAWCRCMTVVVL